MGRRIDETSKTSDKETIKTIYPFNDLIYENLGVDALSKLKNLRKNEPINQAWTNELGFFLFSPAGMYLNP